MTPFCTAVESYLGTLWKEKREDDFLFVVRDLLTLQRIAIRMGDELEADELLESAREQAWARYELDQARRAA